MVEAERPKGTEPSSARLHRKVSLGFFVACTRLRRTPRSLSSSIQSSKDIVKFLLVVQLSGTILRTRFRASGATD